MSKPFLHAQDHAIQFSPTRPALAVFNDENRVDVDHLQVLASLRASLAHIQKDCEFHRKRATNAQDEVDHLTKYVSVLEEERRRGGTSGLSEGSRIELDPEKRKQRLSIDSIEALDRSLSLSMGSSEESRILPDSEKRRLRLSVKSMEALNKSLAKQNDLLRSRTSVTTRFAKKEIGLQTDWVRLVDAGTDPIQELPQISFMGTPSQYDASPIGRHRRRDAVCCVDTESQTETGVWATVEDLASIAAVAPTLPIRGRSLTRSSNRKSLPSYYAPPCPVSPYGQLTPMVDVRSFSVPKPLLTNVARTRLKPVTKPDSYVFLSRNDGRHLASVKRGKSTGSSQPRPRWIP